MPESKNQHDIFKHINSRTDSRVFRNNVGVAHVGNVDREESARLSSKYGRPVTVLQSPRVLRYGLHVGSSDLIGWLSRVVTNDMLGRTIAQFFSIEIKKPGGIISTEQSNWINAVNRFGGCAGIAKTTDEADALIIRGTM